MQIDYDKLTQSLEIFGKAMGVRICILDESGKEACSFGEICRYCEMIQAEPEMQKKCMASHISAGIQAAKLGDCNFYVCHGNMVHLSVALMAGEEYEGSVLAGPILLEYPDSSVLDEVIEKCKVPSGCRSVFLTAMGNVQVIEPQRVYYIGELMFRLIYNLMPDSSIQAMQKQRKKDVQQQMIGLTMQNLGEGAGNRMLQEKQEQELSGFIENGNIKEAQIVLNDILGGIYFDSGNDIELIKLRVNELLGVLARKITKKGIPADRIFDAVGKFQKKSSKSQDIEDISYGLAEVLREFVDILNYEITRGASTIVGKSLEFIHQNYSEEISLEQAAAYAATSVSHLSRVFKEQMQIGFSAYINKYRLECAMELLEENDLSLAEIAQRAGYNNQQYFSRVFKAEYGITPGQYRSNIKKRKRT